MSEGEDATSDFRGGSGYETGYHAPVLLRETVEQLVTDRSGIYVDGTLGGGGHAAAILDSISEGGRVIGIDRDAEARSEARARLGSDPRFSILAGNFGDMAELLAEAGISAVHGILLDLGISSHQVDEAQRGFSYSAQGALDMRMNADEGYTAADVINTYDEASLREILWTYGEEPRARRIIEAVVRARPIRTTQELADIVRAVVPRMEATKSLSRVFQAFRIVVNEELQALENALQAAPELLVPNGRIAVISYHSLEDRRVKRFFRFGNLQGESVKDVYGNTVSPLKELTRKPVSAAAEEIESNPRARSARLRVAERTSTPGVK